MVERPGRQDASSPLLHPPCAVLSGPFPRSDTQRGPRASRPQSSASSRRAMQVALVPKTPFLACILTRIGATSVTRRDGTFCLVPRAHGDSLGPAIACDWTLRFHVGMHFAKLGPDPLELGSNGADLEATRAKFRQLGPGQSWTLADGICAELDTWLTRAVPESTKLGSTSTGAGSRSTKVLLRSARFGPDFAKSVPVARGAMAVGPGSAQNWAGFGRTWSATP